MHLHRTLQILRKPVVIALLALIVVVSALALTMAPVSDRLAQYFNVAKTLPMAVLGLVVLAALAATALAYGFGLEGSLGRSGTDRDQRHRK